MSRAIRHRHYIEGEAVDVEPVRATDDGVEVDVRADDRRWRVVINDHGALEQVVATWENDTLADIKTPAWLADVVQQVRPPA